MVLMLQTEVARRLVAKPGTDDYGSLSVLVQYAMNVSLEFHVSANCFRPRPEVGSSVVSLKTHDHPPVVVRDEATFMNVVRAAFAHRRKTLVNSLRDEGLSQDRVVAALAHAEIDPSRRAETLDLVEFAALVTALESPSDEAQDHGSF
jgi:16S rRNA (adenine1518-N6/adenine1519-N6)-dimethyltransferase